MLMVIGTVRTSSLNLHLTSTALYKMLLCFFFVFLLFVHYLFTFRLNLVGVHDQIPRREGGGGASGVRAPTFNIGGVTTIF